jgi:hypothetical protein
MCKLGKPKATFDKAVLEIEAYIANPTSTEEVITPARKKSLAKVRTPDVNNSTLDSSAIENNVDGEEAEENDEDVATPKKVEKAPVAKRSTVRSSLPKIKISKVVNVYLFFLLFCWHSVVQFSLPNNRLR